MSMQDFFARTDKEIEERINREIDHSQMAYRIKDSEGNVFVFKGIENGIPLYRTNGGTTHVMDLIGYEVLEKYCKLS